jgi:hypothetical protein
MPVAALSKAYVFLGRLVAGNGVSNPAGGMDVCLLRLRRADPSFKGVLPHA